MPRSAKTKTAKNKKIFKLFSLSILVASIAIFGSQYLAFNSIDTNPPKILGKTTSFIAIDKELTLPTTNNSNSPQITLTLVSAEITDQILIGTQKAKASDDKTFLVLEAKLTNQSDKDLQVDLAEAIKLKQIEKTSITATFDNDPLTIPSGSTITTLLGFALTKPTDLLTLLVRTEPFVYMAVPLHND